MTMLKQSRRWVLGLCVVAALAAPAAAQDGSDPLAGSEVNSYLNTLTPEQIDELISQANERRLALERQRNCGRICCSIRSRWMRLLRCSPTIPPRIGKAA